MRWVAVLALMLGCAGPQTPGPDPELVAARRASDGHAAAAHYRKAFARARLSGVHPAERDYVAFAVVLALLREYEECVSFTETSAVGAYVYSAELHDLRAKCLWALDRKDEAAEAAELAIRIDPTSYGSQLIRANYYYRDEPRRAAKAFLEYLESRPEKLEPYDALPLLKLGLCQLRLHRGNVAESVFEHVRKRFHENEKSLRNANNGLCAAYTSTRRFRRAIAQCEQVAADPLGQDGSGAVWYNLAVASFESRHYTRALEAVDEFIARRPDAHKGPELREEILGAMSRQWNQGRQDPPRNTGTHDDRGASAQK